MSCPRLAFCAGHQYCRPPLPSTCRSMELAPSHRPQFAARCQTSTALATFDQVALCGVCTPSKSLSAEETQNFRVSWPSKLLVFASCSHGGPWTCALLSKETAENCLNHGKSRQTISCYDDALIASVAIILGGLCANLRWLAIHISWRFQGILGCSHIFALEFPWISCKWPLQKPAIQMQSRQHLWQPDAKLLCRPHESPFGSPFGTPRSHHFHAANGLGLNMDPRVPGRPICDHIDIISA